MELLEERFEYTYDSRKVIVCSSTTNEIKATFMRHAIVWTSCYHDVDVTASSFPSIYSHLQSFPFRDGR